MNILHLGVYDRNIGDNIATANIEQSLSQYIGNINVSRVSLETFWKYGNSKEFVRKVYNDHVDNIDCILVGGGGLLEHAGYEKKESGWKLPFWEETLKFIKKPVFFYGVGVNCFRGGLDYSEEAITALSDTINHAESFSVRNDGSYNKLKNWIKLDSDTLSKVEVVPDPGLLHGDYFGIKRKDSVSKLGFQPALNFSQAINNNRFGNEQTFKKVKSKFKNEVVYPHTAKDFMFGDPIMSVREFENYYKKTENLDDYLAKYSKIDFVVAMRGHGQMITIGMNIPGIYLSTQDKVRDFSIENGFKDYNVDILENDWEEKLDDCIARMKAPNSKYLKRWYEIRDEFVTRCHQVDKEWVEKNFNKWKS